VLHGTLRNADVYFDGMVAAAREAGVGGETMVVAPQFLADVDAAPHALDERVARWSVEGWKEGAPALHPAGGDPVAASSYAALDALVGHFADRALYPALATLVVAGHSAGGQVLARWAPTSRADEALVRAGVAVRHVIANPSSWLYFDARRPVAGGAGFAVPAGDACAGYDDWKYGLRDPVPYAAGALAGIVPRFLGRDLVILLGAADDDPAHRLLDRSCAARLQGPHRLARGRAYSAYLADLARDAALRHRLLVVPGVGHDNRKMFGSACGRAALFGDAAC
ncbi:MAG: alpha/beta hydrolase, partial [Alphaproteobacteria bacterium]|nr:alpha/beta hydrolase [Alphaproteobacteria bacterium]